MQQQNGYYNEEKSAQLINTIKERIKKASNNNFDPNKKLEDWFCKKIKNRLFAASTADLEHLSLHDKNYLLHASEQYISADR